MEEKIFNLEKINQIILELLNLTDSNQKRKYNEILISDKVTFIKDYRTDFEVENIKIDITEKEKEEILEILCENQNRNNVFKIYNKEYQKKKYSIKFYIYQNKDKYNISIKVLDDAYIYPLKYFEERMFGTEIITGFDYFRKSLLDKSKKGIYIISGNEVFKRKNFLYTLINELNKSKNSASKILFLEDKIEYSFENKFCLITQKEFKIDELEYINYLNPQYIIIETNLNKKIINLAIDNALNGKKVILITNNTVKKSLEQYIRNSLVDSEEGINNLEIFQEIFQFYVKLSKNEKGDTIVESVEKKLSLKES